MEEQNMIVQYLPYLGTLSAFLISIFTLWSSRRTRQAEVENKDADTEHKKANSVQIISNTAIDLVEVLTRRVEKLELRLEVKENENQKLEKRLEDKDRELEMRIYDLEALLRTKDEQIAALQKQRTAMAAKIKEMEEHTVWRDAELVKAIDRIQLLEHERGELQGEVILLNERENRRKADFESLTARFEAVLSKLSQAEKDRDILISRVEFFQSELDKRDDIISNLQQLIEK